MIYLERIGHHVMAALVMASTTPTSPVMEEPPEMEESEVIEVAPPSN
jgi:hypothetical protein